MTRILISTVVVGALAFAGCSADDKEFSPQTDSRSSTSSTPISSGAASSADASFLRAAAESDAQEIAMARAAQAKNLSPRVRQFADMMASDHTRLSNELRQLATRKGVSLPSRTTPPSPDLGAFDGAEYERQYISANVVAHRKVVALFEETARAASDEDVRRFAAGKLPALREHLSMAEDLAR